MHTLPELRNIVGTGIMIRFATFRFLAYKIEGPQLKTHTSLPTPTHTHGPQHMSGMEGPKEHHDSTSEISMCG